MISIETRQGIERKIAEAFITDALEAGYTITVDDGEDEPVKRSADAAEILGAMFTVDEEHLRLYSGQEYAGWVYFVYGNSGWDVVSDHTVNLTPLLVGADAVAHQLEAEHG
jgi:hypothetical protein